MMSKVYSSSCGIHQLLDNRHTEHSLVNIILCTLCDSGLCYGDFHDAGDNKHYLYLFSDGAFYTVIVIIGTLIKVSIMFL